VGKRRLTERAPMPAFHACTLAMTALLLAVRTVAADVVINEVFYDGAGEDRGDYLELYNNGAESLSLADWKVLLIDGATGAAYRTITLPEGASLAAGDYYVIASASALERTYPGVVDQDEDLNGGIQNGQEAGDVFPDAIVLKDAGG